MYLDGEISTTQQCTTVVVTNVSGLPKWKVYLIPRNRITQGHSFIIRTKVADTILILGSFCFIHLKLKKIA